jgi:hypothetical protein
MGELDVDGKILRQEFAKFVALMPIRIIYKLRSHTIVKAIVIIRVIEKIVVSAADNNDDNNHYGCIFYDTRVV